MKTTNAIYHDLEIKSSVKEVYEAVSKPKHLERWWPEKCSGLAEKGELYHFQFTSQHHWVGEVIEAIGDKSFHIKMKIADPNWEQTSFGFDMEEKEGKTMLYFQHTDWPECNAHFKRFSFCWAMHLLGLRNYLEKGVIVRFEDRE